METCFKWEALLRHRCPSLTRPAFCVISFTLLPCCLRISGQEEKGRNGQEGLFQTQVICLETKLEETQAPSDPMTWKWLTRTQDGQSVGRLSQVVQMSGVKTDTMAHSTHKPWLSYAKANAGSSTPSGHVCKGFSRLVV